MWWDVLKEAKTPAAIEHKRKYETQYESTPARKKYRRELERERRKRGVAGKGGKDMSHTKTGKIVPEDPHTNRARSHPSVGSTLKMVIVKAPMWDAQGNQVTGEPKAMPNLKQRGFPFAGAFKQGMKGGPKNEQRLFYESPDESSRAIVDLPKDGDDANMALFGVHMDQQGQGKGREGLVNLKNELGELGKKNLHQFQRFTNMTPESVEFWNKMRSEGVTKAPQMNLDMESAQCASCNAMVDGQQAFATNRIFGETVCLACIQREQEKINQQNDMMYHSEPTDRTQQMTLDGQIAPSTRTTIPVEDPATVRQRIDTNTEKLRQKLEPRTNERFALDAEKAKQRRLKLHAMRAAGNTTLPHQ